MRFLITLTLLASLAAPTLSEPLQYSPDLEAKQRRITRLYVRSRICLGDAARAIMRQGVRESLVVQHFMVSMCGDPMREQLQRDGMSEEEARRTMVELTKKALYEDVLNQPIPN